MDIPITKQIIRDTTKLLLSGTMLLYFIGFYIYMINVNVNGYVVWVKDSLLFYETLILMPILTTWLVISFLQNAKSLYKLK